jgi:hypothetical protein
VNPRDPDPLDPVITNPPIEEKRITNSTAERVEMQRRSSWWTFWPGILGIAAILALGVALMSGEPAPKPGATTTTQK